MACSSKRIIALSKRVYRWLLVTYPTAFRRQYGLQMMQVFLDCCREAYQRNWTRGVLRLWVSTLGDLVITAIAEHASMIIQRLRRQKALFHIQARPMFRGQGVDMLHITNGDSVGGTLRQTGLPGDILIWKDILHEDPTPAGLSLEQMSQVRAQFLADCALGSYEEGSLFTGTRGGMAMGHAAGNACPDTRCRMTSRSYRCMSGDQEATAPVC